MTNRCDIMKRQALLICNSDASGAQHDIEKWKKYLQSANGGSWNLAEIESKVNPSLDEVKDFLRRIKDDGNDFVIVAYAGHGEWKRSTNIELNPVGETIREDAFYNLAPRQIICLDCCRGVSQIELFDEAQERMFSATVRGSIRAAYDRRMMQADPQQVILYACQIGESAYGDNAGGYYTNNLIRQAREFLPNKDFQTVNYAHNLAAPLTTDETCRKAGKNQHPDMVCGRSVNDKQLIIGVSTKMFRVF